MSQFFDGHNDLLLRLWQADDHTGAGFRTSDGTGHMDHDRMRQVGMDGGFFAIFVPPPGDDILATDCPSHEYALASCLAMIDIFDALQDVITPIHSKMDVRPHNTEKIQAVLHIEGAEMVGPDLAELPLLVARGVRSIGPLWSRPNLFGHGAPFTFPGSPDQGAGLTDLGIEFVRQCDQLGILSDVSHLNEAGFWDLAAATDRPLMATHSNAHALCPAPRNLTDRQLDAMAERGSIVGLCFASAYLRDDGAKDANTDISLLLRQLDYLVERMGEHGVALGSDFDGAVIPASIGDCTGLATLEKAMLASGFGTTLTQDICAGNWHRFLQTMLPA